MHFRFVFIIAILFCGSIKLQAQSPRFKLYHYQLSDFCSVNEDASNLYFGVDNKIVVRGDKAELKNLSIVSDSVNVQKLNDSIYIMNPLFREAQCNLYVIEKFTGKRIDSLHTHLTNPAFSFYYSGMPAFNSKYTFETVVRDMKRINLGRTGCTVYTNDIKIVGYKLCLDRGNSTIVSTSIKGSNTVPVSFIDSVSVKCQPGDYLIARDIMLQHVNGTVYRVPEYGLLIYPR